MAAYWHYGYSTRESIRHLAWQIQIRKSYMKKKPAEGEEIKVTEPAED